MGFSLFGTSGDKNTTSNTTTTNNDFTTSDSYNTNTKNVSNAVTTNNLSKINNDTRIQNTALQLTDAFNRFNTYNLAGSGNVNINGGGNADDAAKYIGLLKDLQPNYGGMNNAVPNLNLPLLDFKGISSLAPSIIGESGKVNQSVQNGFAQNTKIAGDIGTALAKITGDQSSSPFSNPLIWIVVAIAAVAMTVLLVVKRK